MSRTVFDQAAEAYDRLRPSYPPGLYEGIERLSGRQLHGSLVVEGGAGTGIATVELVAHGALVLAVDLSLAMTRYQRVPSSAIVASGAALPVRTAVVDLVCYATSFHWVPADEALVEAVRVLRSGGALALWWNGHHPDEDRRVDPRRWFDDIGRPRPPSSFPLDHDVVSGRLRTSGHFVDVRRLEVPWQRSVGIEEMLEEKATHSWVIELGPEQPEFLRHFRSQLEAAWPDGIVHERYLCHLHVALVA